jgi:hypothetical protein
MGSENRGRVPIWAKQPETVVKHRPATLKLVLIFLMAGGFITGGIAVFRHLNWRHFAQQVWTVAGAGNWNPLLLISFLFLGIVVIVLLWKLAILQVSRFEGLTDEKRFDRENEARRR